MHYYRKPKKKKTEYADDGRVNIDVETSKKTISLASLPWRLPGCKACNLNQNDRERPKVPRLNVLIQVVGSRGDIQPFVALGLALARAGHCVRVATHETFKDLVEIHGLEFFNIGGDPKRLMAYMVKNTGLLPGMDSLRNEDLSQQNRANIRDILDGCWRSCFQSPYEDSKPFFAHAIIANPPSFAHIHCAEKLGVPLHLMFT
jgi:sterol 3beta-glucosyltransferase